MITYILVNNIKIENKTDLEVKIPSINTILFGKNCTLGEWDDFKNIVNALLTIKYYFNNTINFSPNIISSREDQESLIEIHMEWEEKLYKYTIVFYEKKLVMESLTENGYWVFSRFKDNPDFALNPSKFIDQGYLWYNTCKDDFETLLISYFIPGEELIKELKNTIIVDDWIKLDRRVFIDKLKIEFPDINYRNVVEMIIRNLGFSDSFKGIDETCNYLYLNDSHSSLIPIEMAGSGFMWLCYLVPLMKASKENNLLLISNKPIDESLHPNLASVLMKWFLNNNKVTPICRLRNFSNIS